MFKVIWPGDCYTTDAGSHDPPNAKKPNHRATHQPIYTKLPPQSLLRLMGGCGMQTAALVLIAAITIQFVSDSGINVL